MADLRGAAKVVLLNLYYEALTISDRPCRLIEGFWLWFCYLDSEAQLMAKLIWLKSQ